MPPKVYKKPVPSAKVEKPIPTEQSRDNSNEIFMNTKNFMSNRKILQRVRIMTSLLYGVITGLLDLNQLEAFLGYFIFHLLVTGLLFIRIGRVERYYLKTMQISQGIMSGMLLFVCAWLIIHNIVYTL